MVGRKGNASIRAMGLVIVCIFVFSTFVSQRAFHSYQINSFAEAIDVPRPATLVDMSAHYSLPTLAGIRINPDKPFELEFILSSHDLADASSGMLREEAELLIKYFLAGLTIPEENLWVNLSPYEQDRVAPHALSGTDLGRDLLSQDYVLKQLLASLTYPEAELGRAFWKKTYQEIYRVIQAENIPVNTFNKIWIIPGSVSVYEEGTTALIGESSLKAMLEEDYRALQNNRSYIKHESSLNDQTISQVNRISSRMVREILLPQIEQEINSGRNFARLRQIYSSLILAVWFKNKLKESVYTGYINKEKISGIDIVDTAAKEKIYQLYLEAFKKGIYNYIKSEYDNHTGRTVKRRYYSGGADFTKMPQMLRPSSVPPNIPGKASVVRVNVAPITSGRADEQTEDKLPQMGKRVKAFKIFTGENITLITQSGKEQVLPLGKKGKIDLERIIQNIEFFGFSKEKQDLLTSLLNIFRDLPEERRPSLYTFDSLVDDLFGFVSIENNFIAIFGNLAPTGSATQDIKTIAYLHELFEYLVAANLLTLHFRGAFPAFLNALGMGRIFHKNDAVSGEIVMSARGREIARIKINGESLRIALRDKNNPHYLLRAVQRYVFGESDRFLTQYIRSETQNMKLLSLAQAIQERKDVIRSDNPPEKEFLYLVNKLKEISGHKGQFADFVRSVIAEKLEEIFVMYSVPIGKREAKIIVHAMAQSPIHLPKVLPRIFRSHPRFVDHVFDILESSVRPSVYREVSLMFTRSLPKARIILSPAQVRRLLHITKQSPMGIARQALEDSILLIAKEQKVQGKLISGELGFIQELMSDFNATKLSLVQSGLTDWGAIAAHILSRVGEDPSTAGMRLALMRLRDHPQNFGIKDPQEELSVLQREFGFTNRQALLVGLALGLGWGQGIGVDREDLGGERLGSYPVSSHEKEYVHGILARYLSRLSSAIERTKKDLNREQKHNGDPRVIKTLQDTLDRHRQLLDERKMIVSSVQERMDMDGGVRSFLAALHGVDSQAVRMASEKQAFLIDAINQVLRSYSEDMLDVEQVVFVSRDSWAADLLGFSAQGMILSIPNGRGGFSYIVLISSDLEDPLVITKTLIHEALHKQFSQGRYDNSSKNRQLVGLFSIFEEATVERQAGQITEQLCRSNPAIREMLLERKDITSSGLMILAGIDDEIQWLVSQVSSTYLAEQRLVAEMLQRWPGKAQGAIDSFLRAADPRQLEQLFGEDFHYLTELIQGKVRQTPEYLFMLYVLHRIVEGLSMSAQARADVALFSEVISTVDVSDLEANLAAVVFHEDEDDNSYFDWLFSQSKQKATHRVFDDIVRGTVELPLDRFDRGRELARIYQTYIESIFETLARHRQPRSTVKPGERRVEHEQRKDTQRRSAVDRIVVGIHKFNEFGIRVTHVLSALMMRRPLTKGDIQTLGEMSQRIISQNPVVALIRQVQEGDSVLVFNQQDIKLLNKILSMPENDAVILHRQMTLLELLRKSGIISSEEQRISSDYKQDKFVIKKSVFESRFMGNPELLLQALERVIQDLAHEMNRFVHDEYSNYEALSTFQFRANYGVSLAVKKPTNQARILADIQALQAAKIAKISSDLGNKIRGAIFSLDTFDQFVMQAESLRESLGLRPQEAPSEEKMKAVRGQAHAHLAGTQLQLKQYLDILDLFDYPKNWLGANIEQESQRILRVLEGLEALRTRAPPDTFGEYITLFQEAVILIETNPKNRTITSSEQFHREAYRLSQNGGRVVAADVKGFWAMIQGNLIQAHQNYLAVIDQDVQDKEQVAIHEMVQADDFVKSTMREKVETLIGILRQTIPEENFISEVGLRGSAVIINQDGGDEIVFFVPRDFNLSELETALSPGGMNVRIMAAEINHDQTSRPPDITFALGVTAVTHPWHDDSERVYGYADTYTSAQSADAMAKAIENFNYAAIVSAEVDGRNAMKWIIYRMNDGRVVREAYDTFIQNLSSGKIISQERRGQTSDTGGIDFRSLSLNQKNSILGNKLGEHFEHIQGFTFLIVQIQPIASLSHFLEPERIRQNVVE